MRSQQQCYFCGGYGHTRRTCSALADKVASDKKKKQSSNINAATNNLGEKDNDSNCRSDNSNNNLNSGADGSQMAALPGIGNRPDHLLWETLTVCGRSFRAMIDTGAERNFIRLSIIDRLDLKGKLQPCREEAIYVGNNQRMDVAGTIVLEFFFAERWLLHRFNVCAYLAADIIIGGEILIGHQARILYGQGDKLELMRSECKFCEAHKRNQSDMLALSEKGDKLIGNWNKGIDGNWRVKEMIKE